MSFACIFVPDFSLQAVLRSEPELHSQPVAVVEGKPPLEKIICVNEHAQAAGVSPGMTKLQVEGSAEIALRDRSEFQESAAHQALLDCAQAFSPRIEDYDRDTILLDLTGLEKLFGPFPKIAGEIFHRVLAMGLRANVAVAGTLDAALFAAHGFAEVTVIPQGKEAEVLGGLHIEVLFAAKDVNEGERRLCGEEVLKTLHRWGIRKFRDLAALPENTLSERLGQLCVDLQRKARGKSSRMLVACDPQTVFEETIDLDFPLVLLEPLAFLLNQMLDQLCMRLQSRSLAAQEIHLTLTLDNGRQGAASRFQRVIHLPVPLLNAGTFLKLLQLDLKAHPPGAPVTKIHLRIEPAKPRPGQSGLFVPSSPEPEKLELTLARIAAVVGENRAGSPQLLDTHHPQAFAMQRFVSTSLENSAQPRKSASLKLDHRDSVWPTTNTRRPTTDDLVTALRIFRPPVVVTAAHQDGRPAHISSRKPNHISGEVVWAAGPWRSSGDWWEQDAWVRDEWDIALQGKGGIALYRLVHDVLAGRWMLEGSYD